MGIRPVGDKFYHAENGRQYTTKLIVANHNFANVPKN
jgi:hypothetical protein